MTQHSAEEMTKGPPEVDVTNDALAAEWLRHEIGRGRLAGFFARGSDIVYTPHEGEDGYQPLTQEDGDRDGPAQVRPAPPIMVADVIDTHFNVFRTIARGEDVEQEPALFPKPAADRACSRTEDRPHLRRLHGVVHTPIFRPDGSLLDRPGYDDATGVLYLPEPGVEIPPVPVMPTEGEVKSAVWLIDRMVADFPFESEHDRANYIGLLLTPLLRELVGPPYKLGAIEAHQRGSGKTLLANIIRHIHGGVFRGEMPEDDAELRKQVSTILLVTTGPVVVIDNVSGVLRSSTLAALLTASVWEDRKLGTMTEMVSRPNDRLWVITGNNVTLGGDLPRRTLRVTIDPKTPQPELRTGFGIADLETWVREHRGELLAALLTMVRAWVVAGRPLGPERSSDGYARWVQSLEGILHVAGIAGGFDHVGTQVVTGHDDEEWADFLAAIYHHHGTDPWTCRGLLDEVRQDRRHPPYNLDGSRGRPKGLTVEDLPSELTRVGMHGTLDVTVSARSLGRWMANRRGRWAGDFTVREAGSVQRAKRWRIEKYEMPQGGVE